MVISHRGPGKKGGPHTGPDPSKHDGIISLQAQEQLLRGINWETLNPDVPITTLIQDGRIAQLLVLATRNKENPLDLLNLDPNNIHQMEALAIRFKNQFAAWQFRDFLTSNTPWRGCGHDPTYG